MRALVTGATGFVGTHLLAHLRSCGDTIADPVTDITDAAAIDETVRDLPGGAPDVVYHLAGQADVGRSWTDVSLTWSVNTMGTVNLLEALRRHASEARIIVISSAEVYGKVPADELPIPETRPTSQSSPYGASKIAAELAALFAGAMLGQRVIVARPFNHLGVGQSPGFLLPAVAKQIAEAERDGLDAIALGNLDARRDLTAVQDVVRAYRLLAERGVDGETYNICHGEAVRVGDLVEQMLARASRPLRVELDPSRLRPSDIPVQFGDSSKLRQHTGWAPTIALDEVCGQVLAEWRTLTANPSSTPS